MPPPMREFRSSWVNTDRILEILINLIDNAIKFTPMDGAVTVRASRMRSDPDFVCISVSDTGPGVTPESRHLIFERLYQSPHSVESSRKGLGLGLFIAKELVTLHGGRIWVASEPGAAPRSRSRCRSTCCPNCSFH